MVSFSLSCRLVHVKESIGLIFEMLKVSLGEMVAYLPIPGGHIKLAERFVDPAFSFTMGWNYWYNWTIILPAELSAASVLMTFWKSVSQMLSFDRCLRVLLTRQCVIFYSFAERRGEPCCLDNNVFGYCCVHQHAGCR